MEDSSDVVNFGSDLGKILETLEVASVVNKVDIAKVNHEVDGKHIVLKNSRIDDLEGKVISMESRIFSIEKQGIDLANRQENIEKVTKKKDDELDDLSNQIAAKQTAMERIEERFSELEKFNDGIKKQFITILETCEGFQRELEELKEDKFHLIELIERDEKSSVSCSLTTNMPPTILPNTNAATVSQSVSLTSTTNSSRAPQLVSSTPTTSASMAPQSVSLTTTTNASRAPQYVSLTPATSATGVPESVSLPSTPNASRPVSLPLTTIAPRIPQPVNPPVTISASRVHQSISVPLTTNTARMSPSASVPPTTNGAIMSPSAFVLPTTNAARMSPSVSVTTNAARMCRSVSEPLTPRRFGSTPYVGLPLYIDPTPHDPVGLIAQSSRLGWLSDFATTRYNWKYPVDQQVVFGPIPGHFDHDASYIFLRTAFHSLGQVCSMFLSQTMERDPISRALVKFGCVVFVDKVFAEMALKIGKISLPGGFDVALKEVPKPWLTS